MKGLGPALLVLRKRNNELKIGWASDLLLQGGWEHIEGFGCFSRDSADRFLKALKQAESMKVELEK